MYVATCRKLMWCAKTINNLLSGGLESRNTAAIFLYIYYEQYTNMYLVQKNNHGVHNRFTIETTLYIQVLHDRLDLSLLRRFQIEKSAC